MRRSSTLLHHARAQPPPMRSAAERPAAMPQPPGGGRRVGDAVIAWAARLVGATIRMTGRGQGATLPGLLAELCAPGITRRRAAAADRVILVSGTNGKTTTTAMLTAALAAAGHRVTSNAAGSNLYRGLTTALLGADAHAQDVVLEVDEAVLPRAIDELRPDLVVLLNLSRDQLDRHHEVQRLALAWRDAVGRLPAAATVVADSGDPRAAWAAQAAPHAVLVRVQGRAAGRDGAGCPVCGDLLNQSGFGRGRCERCGWSLPAPTVQVQWDGHEIRLQGLGSSCRLRLAVATAGQALDAAAAWAAAIRLGVGPERATAAIAGLGTVQDRYAEVSWQGIALRLLLAKNPAGWDEALTAATDQGRAAVVAVNGRGPDGRDTSWLWDVEMGRLGRRPLVVATGERAADAALRLEVAGVACTVVRPLQRAIRRAGGRQSERGVDLFADYTSFQQARKLIRKRG
jgi:lipid II isoglutaminyl synthase (glutamine-hydrolysing)